jgi:hypothetical protein
MMVAITDINNGVIEVIDKLLLLSSQGHRHFVVDDAKVSFSLMHSNPHFLSSQLCSL